MTRVLVRTALWVVIVVLAFMVMLAVFGWQPFGRLG
jgi:hypothetical protein